MTSPAVWTTLGEMCAAGGSIQTGPFGSQLHASDYIAAGTPVVMPTNIGENRVEEAGIARVATEHVERLSRHKVRAGDVVYSRRGDITKRALIRGPQAGWLCGTGCLLVRPGQSADPTWLSYWLGSPLVHDWLIARAVGATMPNLNTEILSALPVLLPPLDEQRRIAGVLGALDDLIEVDRQLIADLRALVRSTYESAVACGASVVAGDVIDFKYGKALPARERRPGRFPVVSSAGIVDSHDKSLVSGPGVVVGRKGTVGSVTWVDADFFPIDTAFYVQTELPMLYAFLALESVGLSGMNTDSAVPGLNRENALRRSIKVLPESDLARLMSVIHPLWNTAQVLEVECSELASTRDELLPLLMSGRVRVGDVAA